MAPLILGIDFNCRTSKPARTFVDMVFVREGEEPQYTRYECYYSDPVEVARRVGGAMRVMIQHADVVVVERPWSKNRGTVASLMRLQGAILANASPDAKVVEVHPQKWKKNALDKSNATKEEVQQWVRATVPAAIEDDWDDNACDAYCIALYGKV